MNCPILKKTWKELVERIILITILQTFLNTCLQFYPFLSMGLFMSVKWNLT